jgi:molybdenum cofactor guanylyltransferase
LDFTVEFFWLLEILRLRSAPVTPTATSLTGHCISITFEALGCSMMNLKSLPPIKGLILAGGLSTRMGVDKASLDYHGVPQYQYLNELLHPFVEEVYISCRSEQTFDVHIPRIEDQYQDIGPLAGVLSAFKNDSTCAWWVIACDLPYVDADALSFLLSQRDITKEATFYYDPETLFPEPLLTIFEPSIYPELLKAYQSGLTSLNRILLNCKGKRVKPADVRIIRSLNTKEEAQGFKKIR